MIILVFLSSSATAAMNDDPVLGMFKLDKLELRAGDGEDLFNTVKSLVDLYIEVGILGWEYSDFQDGIIDYVYSTHGFTGQGLEENGYQLQQGTWADFKADLDKVLVCGIYYKYDDLKLGDG